MAACLGADGFLLLPLRACWWGRGDSPRVSAHYPGAHTVISCMANRTTFEGAPGVWPELPLVRGRACRYIVYVADAEVQHKIFSNVHAQGFELIGHPFGKKIFGENNMIMMRGEQHKDLRRRLLPLFSVKALGVYVQIQVRSARAHAAPTRGALCGPPACLLSCNKQYDSDRYGA